MTHFLDFGVSGESDISMGIIIQTVINLRLTLVQQDHPTIRIC